MCDLRYVCCADLIGTLPSTVGSLASVTHLDLSINNLRGV